ncbi:MAG: hypothetical protein QN201_11330 [Armatimonadota bacterium]|nr:hypothetical protein [Armatimonadota bacterium]
MGDARASIPSAPIRRGLRPRTASVNPHQPLDQNGPLPLQQVLFERARALPGVQVEPSKAANVVGAKGWGELRPVVR